MNTTPTTAAPTPTTADHGPAQATCEDAPVAEDYDYDDPMDGDHESALASCGFGTDEDYGYFGGDEDWF